MTDSVTRKAMVFVSKHAYEMWMKENGWKRKQPHLYKQASDVYHCINFQASQWGSATSGSFTVSVSVTWQSVYSSWTSRSFPKNPATALFPISERIGFLTPGSLDKWWDVSAETDLDHLADEVSSNLQTFGQQFFEDYPNQDTVLKELRAGNVLPGMTEPQRPLVQAIMEVNRGEMAEAKQKLVFAFKRASGTPFQETVSVVAKRIGIRIE